jgi:hypothetical protein
VSGEFARANHALGELLTQATYTGASTRGTSAAQVLAETPVTAIWATPTSEAGTSSALKDICPYLLPVSLQYAPSNRRLVTNIFMGRAYKSAAAPLYTPSLKKEACIGLRSYFYVAGSLNNNLGRRTNQAETPHGLRSSAIPTLKQSRDMRFSGALLGDFAKYKFTPITYPIDS